MDSMGGLDEPVATISRTRLIVAALVTLAALPLLVLGTSWGSGDGEVAAGPTTETTRPVAPKGVSRAPTTAVTAVEPGAEAADAAGEAVEPLGVAATPTTRPLASTTTTEPPRPRSADAEAEAPPPPPEERRNEQEGEASWSDLEQGACAHRSIPFGTVLRVTNLDNGRRSTCTVRERGPYVEGRILELDRSVFSELAPTNAGVLTVRIEW